MWPPSLRVRGEARPKADGILVPGNRTHDEVLPQHQPPLRLDLRAKGHHRLVRAALLYFVDGRVRIARIEQLQWKVGVAEHSKLLKLLHELHGRVLLAPSAGLPLAKRILLHFLQRRDEGLGPLLSHLVLEEGLGSGPCRLYHRGVLYLKGFHVRLLQLLRLPDEPLDLVFQVPLLLVVARLRRPAERAPPAQRLEVNRAVSAT
mmetsp:Transcript_12088/g.30673  ORF Transcript_12088/g.30673 Transcript_12088/m.30673 type:complete len:204 (-) Transcript_12088:420-1031(-)